MREKIYCNDIGSSRLAEARAGVLRTREFVADYNPEVDNLCDDCNVIENVEHILFECRFAYLDNIKNLPNRVNIALGFSQDETVDKAKALSYAKQTLKQWFYSKRF